MALGLQRNQEAISTDESLGAARAMMGWGHGGSVIIQIGLGRQRWDMQRGAGQEGLEMAQRQNLCVCVCWGSILRSNVAPSLIYSFSCSLMNT